MKNKICGECKHFQKVCQYVTPSTNAAECLNFKEKVITNGDKIRQMSDEELAETLVFSKHEGCFLDEIKNAWIPRIVWFSILLPRQFWEDKSEAIAATVAELKKEYKEQSR